MPSARKKYARFHGKNPDKVTEIDFTMPKTLVFLAAGVAIEYTSDKKLNGTHKKRLYRHKFGKGVKIYLHPNERWLLISGGKFKVTNWMRN